MGKNFWNSYTLKCKIIRCLRQGYRSRSKHSSRLMSRSNSNSTKEVINSLIQWKILWELWLSGTGSANDLVHSLPKSRSRTGVILHSTQGTPQILQFCRLYVHFQPVFQASVKFKVTWIPGALSTYFGPMFIVFFTKYFWSEPRSGSFRVLTVHLLNRDILVKAIS